MGSGFQALSHSMKGLNKAIATVFCMMTGKRSGLSLLLSLSPPPPLSVCLSVCFLYEVGKKAWSPSLTPPLPQARARARSLSLFCVMSAKRSGLSLSLARSLALSLTLTHSLTRARVLTLSLAPSPHPWLPPSIPRSLACNLQCSRCKTNGGGGVC
jgi:hypothetical protein